MRDLNYQLKQLCRRNRDGSFATQHLRERTLTLIANQLHGLGYRHMNSHSLKPKHVEALVRHWQEQGLSVATLKFRMAALRWWAQKVDRQNVIARSNDHYGIARRRYVNNVSKAQAVTAAQLAQVRDLHVRMSLELQQAFGLRREEALKFQPVLADRGDHIQLKGSWTKGGKPRAIPVRSEMQREVLQRARQLAGRGSLIPVHAPTASISQSIPRPPPAPGCRNCTACATTTPSSATMNWPAGRLPRRAGPMPAC